MNDVMKRLETIEFIEIAGKDGALLTMKDIKWLGDTIKHLHTENKRYREALEFYADGGRYHQDEEAYFEGYPPEIMTDKGYKAMEALGKFDD